MTKKNVSYFYTPKYQTVYQCALKVWMEVERAQKRKKNPPAEASKGVIFCFDRQMQHLVYFQRERGHP